MKRATLTLLLFCAGTTIAAGRQPAAPEVDAPRLSASDTLTRFLATHGARVPPYRARRTLEAWTMGGRMRASVEAWTRVDADGRFHYDVIAEDGSSLIREHVLLKALATEQRSHEPAEHGRAALTPANYRFTAGAVTRTGELAVTLSPRRTEPMLLHGLLVLRAPRGDIASLNGRPSETPSWWTRRVDVGQRYARINDVDLPVEMWSAADIRVAGESHFHMRYVYVEVGGRPVDPYDDPAREGDDGPSSAR